MVVVRCCRFPIETPMAVLRVCLAAVPRLYPSVTCHFDEAVVVGYGGLKSSNTPETEPMGESWMRLVLRLSHECCRGRTASCNCPRSMTHSRLPNNSQATEMRATSHLAQTKIKRSSSPQSTPTKFTAPKLPMRSDLVSLYVCVSFCCAFVRRSELVFGCWVSSSSSGADCPGLYITAPGGCVESWAIQKEVKYFLNILD
mgnify:CR=1 FL=1